MKPTEDDIPLSMVVPIQHQALFPVLWISTRPWTVRHFEENDGLQAQGWRQASSPQQVLQLQSQLVDVASVPPSEIWYQSALEEPLSVLLAFTLASMPDVVEEISMMHPLPPPQLGEYGVIDGTAYHIMDLPLEARQRWADLGERIRSLAAPLTVWQDRSGYHDLVADEQQYEDVLYILLERHRAETLIEPRNEDVRFTLTLQLRELKIAHQHRLDLQTSLTQADWLEQWQAIQQVAQLLAQDYLLHHQAGVPASTVSLLGEESKRSRRRAPKPVMVRKQKEELLISSNILNHEIIKSLRQTAGYTSDPISGLLEHKHSFQKNRGQIAIVISPLRSEGFDTLLAALNTLGDGCVDTYIAVMAMAIERYGVQHLRTAFEISPDDILAVRGKKPSNGSFTAYQRADVIKELKTLSQARVIASMPGPGRRGRKGRTEGTEIRVEGALIDLLDFTIGEYSLVTGEEIWEKRSIVLGKWVSMIPELDSQTAVMLRQVLAYSGINQRYQKRLGLHLSIMFRINARHDGLFPHAISLRALFDMAGIIPQRKHPADFKEAIERALQCLQRDRVIGHYWQVVDTSPAGEEAMRQTREQAYGWLDQWLNQQWNFSPPEKTRQRYSKLLPEGSGSITDDRTIPE